MEADTEPQPAPALGAVRALVFDVFGTVVDWRGSILAELQALGRAKGIAADWASFTDDWRRGYQPAMQRVRSGTLAWTTIDGLHRLILDELLARYAISSLDEDEKRHLNRAWHRLAPWPDAVAGLTRLKRRFIIGTLSNGNMALLVNMAKHAGLPDFVRLGPSGGTICRDPLGLPRPPDRNGDSHDDRGDEDAVPEDNAQHAIVQRQRDEVVVDRDERILGEPHRRAGLPGPVSPRGL